LFMLLGILFAGILAKYIYSLTQDIHSMAEKVSKLDSTIGHEQGSPILHYSILREIENELQELRQDAEVHANIAEKHYDAISRLNSGEAFVHCNVDKCPYMGKLAAGLMDIAKRFEQFDLRAEESRRATGLSIEEIRSQNKTLAEEVSAQGKQLVQLLSDVLMGRGKAK